MTTLFNFFIERWRLAISIGFFGIMLGVVGILGMNKQAFPPVNTGNVIISTIYPGSSSEEVKNEVSKIIEDQLKGVNGLKDVTSISQNGLSRVIVRIDIDGYNYKEVFDDIQKAVNKAGPLPNSILTRPSVIEIKSDELPIMLISISGANSSRELDASAKKVKDTLELLQDVARVDLSGYSPREFQIRLDPKKLDRWQLSVAEVIQSVQNSVKDIPAGNIESKGQSTLVKIVGKTRSIDTLLTTVVRSNFDGKSISIQDIGDVVDVPRDKDIIARIDGKEAIKATIVKKAASDTIETVARVRSMLDQMKPNLPEHIVVDVYDDEGERVKNKLGIAINNAMIGFFLVTLFLLVFFPNLAGVFTAISLPIVVMFTLGIIPLLGADFNNVTLLAIIISLGLLVDNAIVVGENYIRIRKTGKSRLDSAKEGVAQFWIPISATAMTTIAAFVPMLVTKGIMGDFLKYIPIVVTTVLVISLIESFLLLPARLRFAMKRIPKKETKKDNDEETTSLESLHVDDGWFKHIQKKFEKIVKVAIRFRYFTLFCIFSMVAASIFIQVRFNYFDVFPKNDVEMYFGRFETQAGTSQEKTLQLGKMLKAEISRVVTSKYGEDALRHVVLIIGNTQQDIADSYANFGDHTGNLTLFIDPTLARKTLTTDFLKLLRIKKPQGITDLSWIAKGDGPPVGKALEKTLISTDTEQLKLAAKEFKEEIQKISGVYDVVDNQPAPIQEIKLTVDQKKIAGVGLSLSDVGFALRSSLEGTLVSTVNVEGENIGIRVRYKEEAKNDQSNIGKIKIPNPRGYLISTGNVSKLEPVSSIPKIVKYQYQESITVSCDVDNENINAVALNTKADIIKEKMAKKFPAVSFVTLGMAESTNESVGSLMHAMGFAILGIILILVFIFNSFSKPFVVLLSIPLSLIGVFTAFVLHDLPLSFFALVGIVGLAGVVINGAIILISFIDDLKKENKLAGHSLLARATSARLRPVLVTTLTTVGGLLPTAYGLGGHDPMLKPLTLAMGWGLVSGTILVLIAVPATMAILEDFGSLFSKIGRKLK